MAWDEAEKTAKARALADLRRARTEGTKTLFKNALKEEEEDPNFQTSNGDRGWTVEDEEEDYEIDKKDECENGRNGRIGGAAFFPTGRRTNPTNKTSDDFFRSLVAPLDSIGPAS